MRKLDTPMRRRRRSFSDFRANRVFNTAIHQYSKLPSWSQTSILTIIRLAVYSVLMHTVVTIALTLFALWYGIRPPLEGVPYVTIISLMFSISLSLLLGTVFLSFYLFRKFIDFWSPLRKRIKRASKLALIQMYRSLSRKETGSDIGILELFFSAIASGLYPAQLITSMMKTVFRFYIKTLIKASGTSYLTYLAAMVSYVLLGGLMLYSTISGEPIRLTSGGYILFAAAPDETIAPLLFWLIGLVVIVLPRTLTLVRKDLLQDIKNLTRVGIYSCAPTPSISPDRRDVAFHN